jgi:hypothetical protein
MTTPTTDRIRDFAQELYFIDNPEMTTPEDKELKESGYWETAQRELMRSGHAEHQPEALAFLEQQAAELGRRVVTDEEHGKLVDLERKLDQLKRKEKKLSETEKALSLREIRSRSAQLEKKIEKREKPEMYELGKLKRFQVMHKKKPEQPAPTSTTQKHKGCYIPKTKCARSLWAACKKRKIGCPKCQRLIQISCRKKRGGFPKFPKFS